MPRGQGGRAWLTRRSGRGSAGRRDMIADQRHCPPARGGIALSNRRNGRADHASDRSRLHCANPPGALAGQISRCLGLAGGGVDRHLAHMVSGPDQTGDAAVLGPDGLSDGLGQHALYRYALAADDRAGHGAGLVYRRNLPMAASGSCRAGFRAGDGLLAWKAWPHWRWWRYRSRWRCSWAGLIGILANEFPRFKSRITDRAGRDADGADICLSHAAFVPYSASARWWVDRQRDLCGSRRWRAM